MESDVLANLRSDFTAAISSSQNDVTLDPAIAKLRRQIADPGYLQPFSIYSRGHLRQMDQFLCRINNALLKEDPERVASAVGSILTLFERLEITVKQSDGSAKRIAAARSS